MFECFENVSAVVRQCLHVFPESRTVTKHHTIVGFFQTHTFDYRSLSSLCSTVNDDRVDEFRVFYFLYDRQLLFVQWYFVDRRLIDRLGSEEMVQIRLHVFDRDWFFFAVCDFSCFAVNCRLSSQHDICISV